MLDVPKRPFYRKVLKRRLRHYFDVTTIDSMVLTLVASARGSYNNTTIQYNILDTRYKIGTRTF